LEYERWKIRELKRIRRDREARNGHLVERAEMDRRRLMNNEQILL
jgi:microfibrillar-associated protein 1